MTTAERCLARRRLQPVTDDKLTAGLRSELEKRPDDAVLDIVVELAHDAEAPRSIEEARQAFTERAEPVESAIAELGGVVVDKAWINSTLHARVPAGLLPRLSGVESVAALDVPHRITPD